MKLSVTIRPPQRQVIRWDNPISIADGYSVWAKLINGEPGGQFAFAPICITNATLDWIGTWSANQIATRLTNAQFLDISNHQRPDPQYTLKQKMNWAANGGDGNWGSPIRATYVDSAHWYAASEIQMITAIYADQWVEILNEYTFTLPFNGSRAPIEMYEIKTYQPDEWDHPLAFQEVTAVDAGNEFNYPPVGRVRLPIYFGADRRAFVFKRWLVN